MNNDIKSRLKAVMDDLLLERPGNTELRLIGKKEVLNSSDVLMIFKICPQTLYRWRKRRVIKFRKVSSIYYFFWIDLLPLLEGKP